MRGYISGSFVSLGLTNMPNVRNHIKDKNDPVILCCDADDPSSKAWETSENNLKKLQDEGLKVSIIRPKGDNGRDFNDVLKEEGVTAIKAAFKKAEIFAETEYPGITQARPIEEQAVSYRMGRSTKEQTQEEIKQSESELEPAHKPNALELYLECDNKLNQLPSFVSATKEEKKQITSLRQETQLHAYAVWQDAELRAKAQELGLEKIIKQRAQLHKQEIMQSLKRESSMRIKI